MTETPTSPPADPERIVFEALGAASVCWDARGVFQDQKAIEIGRKLIEDLHGPIRYPYRSGGLLIIGPGVVLFDDLDPVVITLRGREFIPRDTVATYPQESGDVTILGPEVVLDPDADVIAWKGRNFVPQALVEDLTRQTIELCEALDRQARTGSKPWPTGDQLIALERERQIGKGYTPDHDAQHTSREMISAARAFEFNNATRWPWNQDGFHPRGALWNLVRAGAMFQALADRPTEPGWALIAFHAKENVRRVAAKIDRLLWEVSDAIGGPVPEPGDDVPAARTYGPDAPANLCDWLIHHGINPDHVKGDSLTLNATTRRLEWLGIMIPNRDELASLTVAIVADANMADVGPQ